MSWYVNGLPVQEHSINWEVDPGESTLTGKCTEYEQLQCFSDDI